MGESRSGTSSKAAPPPWQRWIKNAMIGSRRPPSATDSEDPMPDADLTKRILKAVDDGFDDEVAFTAELTRVPSLRRRCAGARRRRRI